MYLLEQIGLTLAVLAAWAIVVNAAFWAWGRLERAGLPPRWCGMTIASVAVFLLLLAAMVIPVGVCRLTFDTFNKATTQRYSLADDSATPHPTMDIINEVMGYDWRTILAPPPAEHIVAVVCLVTLIIWADVKLNRRSVG